MPARPQLFPLLEVNRLCRDGAGPSQFDPKETSVGLFQSGNPCVGRGGGRARRGLFDEARMNKPLTTATRARPPPARCGLYGLRDAAQPTVRCRHSRPDAAVGCCFAVAGTEEHRGRAGVVGVTGRWGQMTPPRRCVDAVEQRRRFGQIEHRRLPGRTSCGRSRQASSIRPVRPSGLLRHSPDKVVILT